MIPPKDFFILVLCGGKSSEREVSLRSGKNVFQALKTLAYKNVSMIDFDGPDVLKKIIDLKISKKLDLVFLTTHGSYGEDGCIQGFLELLDVPYTGSGVEASANCMNKIRTKEILKSLGLNVLPTIRINDLELFSFQKFNLSEDSSFILKASAEGSSRGITKHENLKDLKEYIKTHIQTLDYDTFFIEPFIKGKELTASILELPSENISLSHPHVYSENTILSLPLLELRSKNAFYDYEAKYTSGMTDFILPADLESNLEKFIHKLAINAFIGLSCKNFSRVDFIIDKNSTPWILEINTLPGMTETSDMPAQAKEAGIEFNDLILKIISSSL